MQANKILKYYGLTYDMLLQRSNDKSLNVIYLE